MITVAVLVNLTVSVNFRSQLKIPFATISLDSKNKTTNGLILLVSMICIILTEQCIA